MCPFCVSSDSRENLWTLRTFTIDHVIQLPASFDHIPFAGKPVFTWKYLMDFFVDGSLNAGRIASLPLGKHGWIIGLNLVIIQVWDSLGKMTTLKVSLIKLEKVIEGINCVLL